MRSTKVLLADVINGEYYFSLMYKWLDIWEIFRTYLNFALNDVYLCTITVFITGADNRGGTCECVYSCGCTSLL